MRDICPEERQRRHAQRPLAQRVAAARDDLLRCRSLRMKPHRFLANASHLAPRRAQRGLRDSRHGLLAVRAAAIVAATVALAAAGERGVWIDVPFVKQTRNGCGAANAAMLLRYWDAQGAKLVGAEASLETLHQQLYSAELRGAIGSELEKLLQGAGFRTFAFEGRYEDLEKHLAKGRPLVVCVKPRGQRRLHFALAVGLDLSENVILLNDPARRKLTKMDRSKFLESWAGAGNWTLLAVPRETR